MHAISQIRLTFNQDRPDQHDDDSAGIAVQESKPALQAPPMYKVVLFNDDYTPMDFVVEVLEVFFNLNRELATKVVCLPATLRRPRPCRSTSTPGKASIRYSVKSRRTVNADHLGMR
jgi:hypothetical protein